MRALLAADYLSRLDSFPVAYPSYRVLGLELGAPAIPEYDELDPTPYRRAVWTAQQRGRRALRDLEEAGLLKRREHRAEGNGAQRANDYLALTPSLVVELLLRGAGWSSLPPGDRKVPPHGQDGAPSEPDLQRDRDLQQQSAQPAPPACSDPQPTPPVAAVAGSAARFNSTEPPEKVRGVEPASGHTSSETPPLCALTLRRLQRSSAAAHLAAIVTLCSRPEHRELAEHSVSQLLRALERGEVPRPVGYVRNVISGELASRAQGGVPHEPGGADPDAPLDELDALEQERKLLAARYHQVQHQEAKTREECSWLETAVTRLQQLARQIAAARKRRDG
jgi:hypothetical protein